MTFDICSDTFRAIFNEWKGEKISTSHVVDNRGLRITVVV